jgi:hypothetical protein
MYSLWRVLEMLAIVPWGVTELELRSMVGGGQDGLLPQMQTREVCFVCVCNDYVRVCTYMYMRVCMYACMCVCMFCVNQERCVCICLHACMLVCTEHATLTDLQSQIRMYVYACMNVCILWFFVFFNVVRYVCRCMHVC